MVQKTKESDIFHFDNTPKTNTQSSYIPPKQSANVLFKFMSKLDFLKDILLHNAIIPRYYEEKIDYLKINQIDKIAFPMSCFCDIHLNKLKYHMRKYGFYGIGMNKEWGINQGIQPIHYINEHSDLRLDFSDIFNSSLEMESTERKRYEKYNDYLLLNLFYIKPLGGQMITDGKYEERNFHDEKEWRFIPNFKNVNTELPMLIDQEQMNLKSYNAYSQGLRNVPELWLKINLNEIKYIIVNDTSDRTELINFIFTENIRLCEDERYNLISKIVVFTELGEDW